MARTSTADDKQTFLDSLPKERISNGRIRAALGWGEIRFWRIHELLINDGKIVRGRGYGGTTTRVPAKRGRRASVAVAA